MVIIYLLLFSYIRKVNNTAMEMILTLAHTLCAMCRRVNVQTIHGKEFGKLTCEIVHAFIPLSRINRINAFS